MQKWLKPVKSFRSDNALEYTQHDLQAILKHYGTVSHLSCPGTSQQNGRAEHKLRHILDIVPALLLSTYLPTLFWGEATLTAVYTIMSTLLQKWLKPNFQNPSKPFVLIML